MQDLEGKIVLITGSVRGIGKAIAQHFLKYNAKVIISDIDSEAVNLTVNELESEGEVVGYPCDVSQYSEVAGLFNFIINKFKHINILVNNAGITRDGLFARMSEEDWDNVININLKGVFNCSQQAIKYMMKQKFGNIVNMSSIIGIIGNVGQANYAASKGGVIALTKTLAREYASRNIRVNAIAPGFIDTAMTQAIPDSEKEKIINTIPLKKLGTVNDIAKAVLFLASDDMSSFITSQTLVVDGGMF